MNAPRSKRLSFERLAAAHATSAAGDTLIAVALAGTLFFSVPTAEARARVGLYLLLTMAPFSLLSPLIGPALDRRHGGRRLAIVLAGAGRAALALVMATSNETLLLYPAAFGILVLSRAHAVGRSALVPAVLDPDDELVAANARLAKLAVIGGVVVAGPGILLGRIIGPEGPLVFAALIFGLTTLAGIALPSPRKTGAPAPEPVPLPNGDEMPERIRRAMVVNALIRGAGGFLLFLLAFGLRRRGVTAAGFGLVLAVSGLGSFVGATIVPRLRRGDNEEWVMVVALIVGGGASLIALRSFGTDLAAVLAGAVGMLTSAGRLAFDSIVQREAPEGARARAFAKFETTFQLAWVAGAAIPVALPLGIEPGLAVASVTFLGGALWFLVTMGHAGRPGLST